MPVLCPFLYGWMVVNQKIMSDTMRYIGIPSQVNQAFWPLSQPDIRGLSIFRIVCFNDLLLKELDFMGIAGTFPRDPNLFTDGVHFTPKVSGCAWVALAHFLPYFTDLEREFVPSTQLPTMKSDAGSLNHWGAI